MPQAPCPWCGELTDARSVIELKRDFENAHVRTKAAEKIADSLWKTTDEVWSLLKELHVEDWNETYVEELVSELEGLLSEIDQAKAAFRGTRPIMYP